MAYHLLERKKAGHVSLSEDQTVAYPTTGTAVFASSCFNRLVALPFPSAVGTPHELRAQRLEVVPVGELDEVHRVTGAPDGEAHVALFENGAAAVCCQHVGLIVLAVGADACLDLGGAGQDDGAHGERVRRDRRKNHGVTARGDDRTAG